MCLLLYCRNSSMVCHLQCSLFNFFSVSSSVQSSSTNLSKEWEIHLEIDKILSKIMNIEAGECYIYLIDVMYFFFF